MGKRTWYEVRVREKHGDQWVKKSKFYLCQSAGHAAQAYKGRGTVMWASKVGTEKLLGIGDFFGLGADLLKEFRADASTENVPDVEAHTKDARRKRYWKKVGKMRRGEAM